MRSPIRRRQFLLTGLLVVGVSARTFADFVQRMIEALKATARDRPYIEEPMPRDVSALPLATRIDDFLKRVGRQDDH